MSTMTAQLSDFILRARFRGMNDHEWEREREGEGPYGYCSMRRDGPILPDPLDWALPKASPIRPPLCLSCPRVCFWGCEGIQCAGVCVRLQMGRRWRIRGLCHGKGFEPERSIARRRPAISIHNLVLSPSLYLLSSSLPFFPRPYLFLSLWVIRMHPGCLSACSLITQRETGPNTKYTVCPHLSTAHKVLLQQKTTQGHKWLISRATSWLRLIIVTPPIFKEHNKLLTIYLKLTVITNRILDNNNIYAGLHSCYIIMWGFLRRLFQSPAISSYLERLTNLIII